jgi:Fe2+ or Zn2+ uptake regulation protein
MEKDLQRDLEKSGVYFTHLVKELLEVLVKSNAPLSIDEIADIFDKRKFFPYRSSIFRQIKRLSGLGIIEESVFSDGVKRYCFIYGEKHHHHFECRKCGKIASIPMDSCGKMVGSISDKLEKSGFRISSHVLTLEGICPKCN